jgi:ASC-1-like (ASCH) protein
MAKRHLTIRPEWGEAVRTGRKSIDARPADDVAGLEVGDVVRYSAVRARVARIAFYRGYRDLLAVEDWRQIAPDAADPTEVLRLLDCPAGATGVVAIELAPAHE